MRSGPSPVAVLVLATCGRPEAAADPLAAAEAFFAGRPPHERPWDDGFSPVEGVSTPSGRTALSPASSSSSLSAAACAACHPAIAEEWRLSVHSQAWIDPQFQAEIGKSGNRWLCLNCHTPLLVQQDLWPVSLTDGDVERPVLVADPSFDPGLRDEGITCAACHVKDGVISGPGVGGEAPHPVRVDPAFRSGALCERCHQARFDYPGKSFLCTFDTGREWRDGPWDDRGATCVTCHMPAVERPIAEGSPARAGARHWWRGAGIPKVEGRYPPPEANGFGLGIEVAAEPGALRLTLANAAAGHLLPTGDPERWIQVDVSFRGVGGEPRGEPWTVRIGQEWRWSPTPAKLADNRLAPGERRTFVIPIPAGSATAITEASSHRMSAKNAAYHDLVDYPLSVRTHHLETPLVSPPPTPPPP